MFNRLFIGFVSFLVTSFFCYHLRAVMTETVSQNLVTFLSIVFGFHITSVAILYNSSILKRMHDQIDKNKNARGTHKLASYLRKSGYYLIGSIVIIIAFGMFATADDMGVLSLDFGDSITLFSSSINIDLLISSVIFGGVSINIFFMVLILRAIINGMLSEAAEK